MKFKYVIAIVPPEVVSALETRLIQAGIRGITLSKVKGFGEYKNFFTDDWLSDHVKVEVLADETKVPTLLDALVQAAGSDLPGSGIVAVVPVDSVLSLRTNAARNAPQESCLE